MILGQVFNPKTICVHLESEDKEEVFEELVEQLVSANPSLKREKVLNAILERESLMSTGIKSGIAVPHGKLDGIDGVIGAVGISEKGIDYDSLDKKPVHLIFMILSSAKSAEFHLEVLQRLSKIIEAPGFISELKTQKNSNDVYSVICRYDENLDS